MAHSLGSWYRCRQSARSSPSPRPTSPQLNQPQRQAQVLPLKQRYGLRLPNQLQVGNSYDRCAYKRKISRGSGQQQPERVGHTGCPTQ